MMKYFIIIFRGRKLMKKYVLFFCYCCRGCTPQKDNSQTGVSEKIETVKVKCIKEIQTTYRDVLSPVYIQNKINMAASNRDKDSDIIDNRLLVAYDIETNESQVLFESHYESADIQSIDGNSNWLIFKDIDSIGVQEDFYFMDMKTKSIKELDLNQQESPSFSIPVLFENNIFWINEESVNNDINITVKKYDCISDKVDIIS